MLSRTKAKRAVMAAVVAAAVGASGAATADAATVTRTDDTAADFTAGTQDGTIVAGTDPAAGVEVTRTLNETFAGGPGLPTGWSSTPWDPAGTSTVSGGALVVDGARADSGVVAGPGMVLSFRATLGDQSFSHVGFGTDFAGPPWAMFSTGPDGGGKVYARTSDGDGPFVDVDQELTGVSATTAQDFRIVWKATSVEYYVGPTLVATHAATLASGLHPLVSNFSLNGGSVSVESIALSRSAATFTSRALDAGDARVTGAALNATAITPTGTTITYETRTGADATELAAAAWVPTSGTNGAVTNAKRLVQYRATMTTTDAAVTPRLDKVDVAFTTDTDGPAVTLAVAVTGKTATATFSAAGNTGALQCSLDGGPAADCTSPKAYAGLSEGSHTIKVTAKDAVGNEGSATRTFVVDTTAPKVTIGNPSISGASAAIPFSVNEASTVTCKLDGGAFASCASPATYSKLAAGAHTIVVRAVDGRGNAGSASRSFTIAPSGGGGGGDVTPPNVLVLGRSLKVSDSGVAKLRIRCPRSEESCDITVKLKKNGKRIARKTLTVPGGSTRTFRLKLSASALARLEDLGRMKAKAVITATDAAGNTKTTTRRITLKAPAV